MNPNFKKHLLKSTSSMDCDEIEVIQRLWSGYGKISRYQLIDSSVSSVVVKHISLNRDNEHPRGWNTDFSHKRKVKSYEVEAQWYQHWNQYCPEASRVPKFKGAFSQINNHWIILEDLDVHYPIRKNQLDKLGAKVCLKWLANFHVAFLGKKPLGLWEIGTYWHLNTRPDEFEKIEHRELKQKAHLIDDLLNRCQFQTIVHGDAKLANFCFSEDEKNVAAVDFQYAGGGCGMKDVAYFLGSCLSGEECEKHQDELLNSYFSEMQKAINLTDMASSFGALEKEWRAMYPIACADFTRFLTGWMPSHQKVNPYSIKLMNSVLLAL